MKKIILLFIGVLTACMVAIPAVAAGYLTTEEQLVIDELNKVRANPAKYAQDYLVPLRGSYRGKLLSMPGEMNMITTEGVAALNETISYLTRARPVPLLSPAKGMSMAARDLINEQSKNGVMGEQGSSIDLSEKYGKWRNISGENVLYSVLHARNIVITLLIDDGIPGRGHRENILDPRYNAVGVSIGKHPVYDYMCVMNFAGGYTDNGTAETGNTDGDYIVIATHKKDAGDYRGAIEAYDKAIGIDPKKPEYYIGRANLKNTAGDFAGSVADITTAINLSPDSDNYYYLRGINYRSYGEYEKAKKDLLKALKLNPGDAIYKKEAAMSFYMAGKARYEARDYKQAITEMTSAMGFGYVSPDFYYYRGLSYAGLSQYKKALDDIDRAISLNPSMGEYKQSRDEISDKNRKN